MDVQPQMGAPVRGAQGQREMLLARAEQLRAARLRKQQQRLDLLKTINLKKCNNQSLYLGSDNNFDKSFGDRSLHSKSLNMTYTTKTTNVTSLPRKVQENGQKIETANRTKYVPSWHTVNNGRKSMLPKTTNLPKPSVSREIISEQNKSRKSTLPFKTGVEVKTTLNKNVDRKSIFPKTESNKNVIIASRKSILPKTESHNKNIVIADKSRKSILPKTDLNLTKISTNIKPLPNISRKSVAPKSVYIKTAQYNERPKSTSTVDSKNIISTKTSVLNDLSTKRRTVIGVSFDQKNLDLNKKPTESFAERLSKPKYINKPKTTVTLKKSILNNAVPKRPISKNNNFSSNVNSQFDQDKKLRRSLSTVHFKRLGPEETEKCLKRTYSMGNIKYKKIEDEISNVFPPKEYGLRVESERKKSVAFFTPGRKSSTPVAFLNTPKPSELRHRLNHWLQKRGKSLSTFHHLKCFGLHSHGQQIIPDFNPLEEDDDENKENVEISDDDSFTENYTGEVRDNAATWRQANHQFADSPIVGEPSPKEICTRGGILKELSPTGLTKMVDNPLVPEALFDLHQLILENYSWSQCAEWLRAIVRECGDNVKNIPQYWECRAALEEKRGNFVDTVDCFNNAIQHGAEQKHIEDALGSMLEKFMKLELHPKQDKDMVPLSNQKLIDVKNIFKSSLIRFAVKMQEERDNGDEIIPKKYTATPVRRSNRISCNQENHISLMPNFKNIQNPRLTTVQTPKSTNRSHLVQLSNSLRNVNDDIKPTLIFVPNKALNFNDCV